MDYRNGLDVQDDLNIPEAARLSPQNLELARILKSRGNPYAVDENGTVHHFNVDRETGKPIALPGSRIVTEDRSDGVTVRKHVVDSPDGTVKVLGTDYGTPPEYVAHQPPGIGGDPILALRRQVAVSPQFAALGMQYIDPRSGQVDPARWNEFLKAAQEQGLRMTVTSNGLQNPYYQGMDNARAIAGGYPDSLTVNVYNPCDTLPSDVVESAKSMIFRQQQSVQVAIRDQMREALKYNKDLLGIQAELGRKVAPFFTNFIGHSQGTINGNRAIDSMNENEEQPNIQRFDIGRYYWGETSPDIGKNIIINDKHDTARLGSAWLANNDVYQANPNRQYVWTNFNHDNQGNTGNNHSLYLYLQRPDVQKLVGMRRASS